MQKKKIVDKKIAAGNPVFKIILIQNEICTKILCV